MTRFLDLLFRSIRWISLAATLLLLTTIPFFEFLPIVEKARSFIPPEVYRGENACDCDCLLRSRPWYGTFNYRLWFSLFVVPAVLFYPVTWRHWGVKILSFLVVLGLFYISFVPAVFLHWEIRNAPFGDVGYPHVSSVECVDISDGGRLVFAVFFGWVYGVVYIGFWWLIRWLMLKGIQISGRKKA
jgi:hypothetical protein